MDKIIEYMILEDEGFGDVTSNAVIDKDQVAVAEITSKEDGILAGVNFAKDIFDYITCSCNIYFGTWCCWIYICKWKNRQNAKRKH